MTKTKAAKKAHVTVRLTEQAIRGIQPPASGNQITYDDSLPGLGLRTTAAGSKAFTLTYWFEGQQRRMTIGGWPQWSATGARERAKKLRRQIDRGEDPLAKKQERRAAGTFGALAAEYLERHAIHKRDGGGVDRARLDRDVLPLWKNRKAEDITRADVIRLVETKAQSAPIAANRLLALVRKVFNFAVSRDLLASSPCVQVKAPSEEKRRDRVLTEGEIRTFWQVLETGMLDKGKGKKPAALSMSTGVRAILRVVLTTAQRPGEICGMEWSEIDAEPGWWTIGREKSKNGLAHRVPLSSLAQEILKAQPREGRYVFPSPRGDKPIEVNALAHALRNNEHLGLAHFGSHDLRRTATSHMPADRFIKARILNHSDRETTQIYDRYEYSEEKKRALDTWGRKLKAIITGKPGKVVSIG